MARSLMTGALSAVDKTMAETFMKFAKSAGKQCDKSSLLSLLWLLANYIAILGGFSGLFSMFGAYQRWCQTTSTRAQYYENMLEMCGLLDDPECPKAGRHRELERAEMKKSEEAVT